MVGVNYFSTAALNTMCLAGESGDSISKPTRLQFFLYVLFLVSHISLSFFSDSFMLNHIGRCIIFGNGCVQGCLRAYHADMLPLYAVYLYTSTDSKPHP